MDPKSLLVKFSGIEEAVWEKTDSHVCTCVYKPTHTHMHTYLCVQENLDESPTC